MTIKATSEKKSRGSTHVPDKHYGYTVQTVRCLARLLEARQGSVVSVEVFEDVGLTLPCGRRVAEQDKSALGHNPIADRSSDLWKSLSNWVDASCNGELDPDNTEYVLYITAPKIGQIASAFDTAKDEKQARQALTAARNELWGPYPAYPQRSAVAGTISEYIKNVFTRNGTATIKIVKAFSLLTGSGSVTSDVRELIQRCTFVPSEHIDETLHHALGWVTEQISKAVEEGRHANLHVDAFRNNLWQFIRRLNQTVILRSVAAKPSGDGIDSELALRRYVRQLTLIDCTDRVKIDAVIDFLKASVDRTQWAAQGWVDDEMLNTYEDTLTEIWKNVRRRTEIAYPGLDPCKRGEMVMLECIGTHINIEITEVPSHFPRGSFHALAEQPAIGWHPEYENQLDKKDEP